MEKRNVVIIKAHEHSEVSDAGYEMAVESAAEINRMREDLQKEIKNLAVKPTRIRIRYIEGIEF